MIIEALLAKMKKLCYLRERHHANYNKHTKTIVNNIFMKYN